MFVGTSGCGDSARVRLLFRLSLFVGLRAEEDRDRTGFCNLSGLLVLVLTIGLAPNAAAQSQEQTFCTTERTVQSADVRGLRAVYCTSSPVARTAFRTAHATSSPVFYGGVPAAWAGAALRSGNDFTDAYRLTVTQIATYGLVTGLKRTIRRPRPYVTTAVVSRNERYRGERDGARESMPSGHAGLSMALATSWSLSHPKWYIIAPSALWATTVTVSRLYLGVHYPSDVLAGALLGAGVATAVHVLRDALTPDAFTPDDSAAPRGPTMMLRVRL